MYIEPGTNIRLLKDVPLDNTYDHTIWFISEPSQRAYFISKTKYNLSDYTYQRVGRGRSRVGIKADLLYDCNYLMFQNASFGNKWFYAFITSVEYINNECAEVSFEIDVLQTWFFDYSVDYCFVEREHTISDNIGEHMEPENFSISEYVFNDYSRLYDMTDLVVCLAIVDVDGETVDGNQYDGVYSGTTLWVYDANDTTGINAKIGEYVKSPESVVSIYMFPKTFLMAGVIPENHLLTPGSKAAGHYFTKPAVTASDTLNGYLPKNKKLYTYPYNFYHVDNASGGELTLRYEFFKNLTPSFSLYGCVTQPIMAILRPTDYKGIDGIDGTENPHIKTESISLTSYPMCSWNVDSYQAWVAQNSIPIRTETSLGLAGLAAGAMMAASPIVAAGAAMAAATKIGSLFTQNYQASIQADIMKGSSNNGNPNVAAGFQNFYGGRASITYQEARSFDEYLTMFGYSVRRLKVPNVSSRPHWNYVKTIGATLTGSVPADDMRKLISIYDNGITFWKNATEIGNYALDNSPT